MKKVKDLENFGIYFYDNRRKIIIFNSKNKFFEVDKSIDLDSFKNFCSNYNLEMKFEGINNITLFLKNKKIIYVKWADNNMQTVFIKENKNKNNNEIENIEVKEEKKKKKQIKNN